MHAYQNYCVDFLKSHPESLLILEMGLGKSVITLTAILDLMFDRFEVSKTLVVAPLRVAKTVWPAEGENWEHARFLNLSVTGTMGTTLFVPCGSASTERAGPSQTFRNKPAGRFFRAGLRAFIGWTVAFTSSHNAPAGQDL